MNPERPPDVGPPSPPNAAIPSAEPLRYGTPRFRAALTGVCLIAGLAGFGLALKGLLPPGAPASPGLNTARTRVGYVFAQENPRLTAASWDALKSDLQTVRATIQPPARPVFDLVVAARGLANRGSPDWARAEQLCRELRWTRCDRASLELLRERSRP